MARQVLPSVVYIEMEGVAGRPACYGSGFFVAPTEILTNKHVVTCSGTGRGRVRLADGERSYPTGRILAAPDLDLALVEIQRLTAPPLHLDTARRLSVGDDIFVAGNPEGLEDTFTRGIVSGVRLEGGLLQIDAPVSPGSSGGPVVDSYGMVVGVTVSSIREGQNLNFAIPAPLLASPLGRMRQMLAVGPDDLTPPEGDYAPLGDIWIGPLCAGGDTGARADARAAAWARRYSLLEKRRPVVKLLLAAGADAGASDGEGRTSFDYAAAGGITGLEGLLREAGRPGESSACRLELARSVVLYGLS